jgi:hypothetical protein
LRETRNEELKKPESKVIYASIQQSKSGNPKLASMSEVLRSVRRCVSIFCVLFVVECVVVSGFVILISSPSFRVLGFRQDWLLAATIEVFPIPVCVEHDRVYVSEWGRVAFATKVNTLCEYTLLAFISFLSLLCTDFI